MDKETGRSNGWRVARWSAAAGLLMVPLVMMQFSDDWNWTGEDFLFAAIMIGGALLLYEFAGRASANIAYRAGAALAVAAAFLLIWINLAVGIVGDVDNPTNLGFFLLVLAAGVGVYAAELRARGMARAMLAVGAVQLLLGALIATAPSTARVEPMGAWGVLAISGFFAALWLISAALFRRASRSEG